MEITQGSLQAVFQGLRAQFRDAVREAVPDIIDGLVEVVPSTTWEERYPMLAHLGDLERILDEYPQINMGEFMQELENEKYGAILVIRREHIEDDQVGMYNPAIQRLARRCATHHARHIPYLFVSSDGTATGGNAGGFQTAWVDGANVFGNNHAWPAGQGWDNLDSLMLNQANFELVVQHLQERLGPDGDPMDLQATHLVVGPREWVNAKRLIHRQLIGGGDSNIHYEELTVVKWSRIRDNSWFVLDLSAAQPAPVVVQNRISCEFTAQTAESDEDAFKRDLFNYKVRRRYAMAILCPWLIQAVNWNADTMTTTTPAA